MSRSITHYTGMTKNRSAFPYRTVFIVWQEGK